MTSETPANFGFVTVAAAVPAHRIADPAACALSTIALAKQAAQRGAAVVAFPELGLCGYSIDDLVQQDTILSASLSALDAVRAATVDVDPMVIVGLPLVVRNALFNVAAVLQGGEVLGIVPKSYLPNYREFYEERHFTRAADSIDSTVTVLGREVPFGNDLVFEAAGDSQFGVHVEICEDLWVPIPPSSWAALAGATVLINLSASNITTGKADYRRTLASSHSARLNAAHVYVSAGTGESTTDLAWDGDAIISENGTLLAEAQRFAEGDKLIAADVDLDRLRQERMRWSTFSDQVGDHREKLQSIRRVPFARRQRPTTTLQRVVPRFPYVPADSRDRDARCREVVNIQVQALTTRLRSSGIEKLVIGVSGGLDSTLALLVAVATMDHLKLPRTNVLGYTMPGFATGTATKSRALVLMESLGVTGSEIDIRPACLQMLADIEHPYAKGEPLYDITFENVQAGERTSHLFRLANRHNALVLGTGDLSELALGWCTYGVGDQMSHYNVNASVPKTLIRYLIRWFVHTEHYLPQTAQVLTAIADDVISPELVPSPDGKLQSTEDTIGPYELHDFFLYYLTRFGYRPSKIAYLAEQAWSDRGRGEWSDLMPEGQRNEYDAATIRSWLRMFLTRFMRSQFKRTAMPNAPKVGSGGSLSPRGDWRAPSDASANAWLAELGE